MRIFGAILTVAVASAVSTQVLAADLYPAPPPPPPVVPMTFSPSTAVFFGGNAKEDSYFLYGGFVHALNGDLGRDGWLARIVGGFGEYDYTNVGVPGGKVDSDHTNLDLTVGYQWFLPGTRFSLYGGANRQEHDLSPNDPGNSVEGSEWGFKVQGEAETLDTSPYYGSAIAAYSTANDDYWTRFRLGTRFAGPVIGPELVLQGNDEYDEQRYGVFMKGLQLGPLSTEVSVGYADASGTTGPSSVYGSLGFSFAF